MAVMVLARALEYVLFHRPAEDSKHATVQNRRTWLLLTFLIIFCSFLVCNVLPFVNDLLGFVGAMSGVTTTYVFPYIMAPVILKDEISPLKAKLCQAFALFSSLIAIIGVCSSIHRMANSYQTRSPFTC